MGEKKVKKAENYHQGWLKFTKLTRNFQYGGRVADFQLSSPLIVSVVFGFRQSLVFVPVRKLSNESNEMLANEHAPER